MEKIVKSSLSLLLNYKGNTLELDLLHGAKILSLILIDKSHKPHKIIEGKPFDSVSSFTANGSFLMYPWVNRLESSVISSEIPIEISPDRFDGNGTALHGLFADIEREIIEQTENFVVLSPKYEGIYEKNPFLRKIPKFVEKFIIGEGRLSVFTEFLPIKGDISEGFAYGYHPYVQLDENEINGAKIQTNMSDFIEVDDKLLPIYGSDKEYRMKNVNLLIKNEGIIDKNTNLDHCFMNSKGSEGNFFNVLWEKEGFGVFVNDFNDIVEKFVDLKEKEKIFMRFFQVYTPGDLKRIAIEPQSAGANAYFCGKQWLQRIEKGGKAKYGVFNIILKEI